MQDLIKRYFWILGAAVVMVCSVFAAKATSHIVEAKYLPDPDHAPKIAPVVPSPMQPAKQARSKDGGPFAPITAPAASTEPSTENKDDIEAMADTTIKKIDDTHYEIDKKLVDTVLANPMAVGKGARVVPAVKNGKPDGFKLYAIRPSS